MIPPFLFLDISLDDLQLGFEDFRLEDAIYSNYGAEPTLWTSDQTAELNRDVQETYRWILYPDTLPDERVPHVWTFMEQSTTLPTTSGTYNYTLPTDFGSFVGETMRYSAESGYTPVEKKPYNWIDEMRSYSPSGGNPRAFAIHWLPQDSGARQRQEIVFYPTPDGAYTLRYTYAIYAPPLSTANPYPLGGPRISQLMVEGCKAIGEAKRNGYRGDQWNVFKEKLHNAIRLDKGTNTERSLGEMMPGYRPGPHRSLVDLKSVTYYFGPDAAYGPGLYRAEA